MYKVFDSVNEIVFSSDNFTTNNLASVQELKKYKNEGKNLFHVYSQDPYSKMMEWFKDYTLLKLPGDLWQIRGGIYGYIEIRNDLPKGS